MTNMLHSISAELLQYQCRVITLSPAISQVWLILQCLFVVFACICHEEGHERIVRECLRYQSTKGRLPETMLGGVSALDISHEDIWLQE